MIPQTCFTLQAGKTVQRNWANTFKKSRYDWDVRPAELRMYLEFIDHNPGDSRLLRVEVSDIDFIS